MTSERPQDQWMPPAANADALHMLPIAQKRAKSALFRVIWSGALLILFGFSLTRRLDEAQKNDTTTTFGVITLIVLAILVAVLVLRPLSLGVVSPFQAITSALSGQQK